MGSLMAVLIETGSALYDLARDQSEWSQLTFGTDANRDGLGALKHLEKEAREAQECVSEVRACHMGLSDFKYDEARKNLTTELADCLLLLLDASRRSGVKPLELIKAAQAKMVVNKARTWPAPQDDAPVEHVRQ